MYKNIDKQTKLKLKDQVQYQPGQDAVFGEEQFKMQLVVSF